MTETLYRITIDVDATIPAEEIDGIVNSVGESLSRCWAETTTGPIHDCDGKHVANAKVERIPLSIQIAHEYPGTPSLLAEAREALFALTAQASHVALGRSQRPKVDTSDAEAELARVIESALATLAKIDGRG